MSTSPLQEMADDRMKHRSLLCMTCRIEPEKDNLLDDGRCPSCGGSEIKTIAL